MNKKGSEEVFPVLLVIFIFTLIVAAFVGLYGTFKGFSEKIGTSQLYLMNSYEKGEKVLSYSDMSVRNAFMQAIYDGAKTGFLFNEYCTPEMYYGYTELNSRTSSCFPDMSSKTKSELFKVLPEYYSLFSKEGIPYPDYDFYYLKEDEGFTLYGKPGTGLKLELTSGYSGKCCQVINNGVSHYRAIDEGECSDLIPLSITGEHSAIEAEPAYCGAETKTIITKNDIEGVYSIPVSCTRNCDGKECGSDGCGGSCGDCHDDQKCENNMCVDENPGEPGDTPSEGKCGEVADYAKKYAENRCPYVWNPGNPLPWNNCWDGLTCAMFVYSVYYYSVGGAPSGHGVQKCDQPTTINNKFSELSKLQPGDIFTVHYVSGGIDWGHTGIYVGRGYVKPETIFLWTSHREYTPSSDPNADYIFVHSTGIDKNTGGAGYSSQKELFAQYGGFFSFNTFCRHEKCE